MPVHLYGQMADMDADHRDRATATASPVIEDACQAHGAEYKGRRAGSIGVSGCFSFYPGKNLGACGEGGIVVTNDDDHDEADADAARLGPGTALPPRRCKGFNYRMDGIQGAILRVKLRHLEGWTEARRAHARHYATLLAGRRGVSRRRPKLRRPAPRLPHLRRPHGRPRAACSSSCSAHGIQTGLHYPIPVHLQKAHADLGYRAGDFPQSEAAALEVLSLPLFPEMTAAQVDEVVAAIVRADADVA